MLLLMVAINETWIISFGRIIYYTTIKNIVITANLYFVA